MRPIIDDIKYRFKHGGMLIKLILINIAVYLLLNIAMLIIHGDEASVLFVVKLFATPLDWTIIIKPWTLLTSMFTHLDFDHIFWNMLTLYFSARIFLEYNSEKRLLQMYIIGGLVGVVFMWLTLNVLPFFDNSGIAIGASAATMAITISVCAYRPLLMVNLFGMIPVQLRYIGITLFLLDVFHFYDSNTGGHLAHIGGAIFGFYHGRKLAGAIDILKPLDKFFNSITSIFKKKSDLYVSHSKVRQMDDYEYNYTKKTMQEKVDEILDKISRSGYDSLTKEEKDILHRSSRM